MERGVQALAILGIQRGSAARAQGDLEHGQLLGARAQAVLVEVGVAEEGFGGEEDLTGGEAFHGAGVAGSFTPELEWSHART